MTAGDQERALCSIVTVKSMSPIAGADKIVVAEVNGWQCVISKDEGINEGDLALYFSIDSIPDLDDPNCALVKKRGGRIKTIKLRGIISQGLLAPLGWLSARGHDTTQFSEGDDVTEIMGVTKYIHEEEADQYLPPAALLKASGSEVTQLDFPSFVRKTDETRLQDKPHLLEYIAERDVVITRKEDGSSATFIHNDGRFSICGRNYEWLSPTGSAKNYFLIANKFNIEEGLAALQRNIALQGELVGPKVNANRMRLEEYQYRVFDIWDIDKREYYPWDEVVCVCAELKIATVPVVYRGPAAELPLTVPAFLQLAEKQKYTPQALAEGIVVKTDDPCPSEHESATDQRRVSFKVISNKYLLKHNM